MKRAAVAVLSASLVLCMAGCVRVWETPEDISRISEVKEACEDAGGTFITWRSDLGDRFRCDLSTNHLNGSTS